MRPGPALSRGGRGDAIFAILIVVAGLFKAYQWIQAEKWGELLSAVLFLAVFIALVAIAVQIMRGSPA